MTHENPTVRQEASAAIKRLVRNGLIENCLITTLAMDAGGHDAGAEALRVESTIHDLARDTEMKIANLLNADVSDVFAFKDGAIRQGFGFLETMTSVTADATTALRLFLLTPRTRAFLLATDPEGVEKAEAAVGFTDDERDAVESERDFEKWTAAYRRG